MASLSTSARRGVRSFATATQTRVKTFDNQARVPALPIPQLETETMPLLMKTLRPLAWTDAEWKAVQTKAADFVAPGGMGEKLQKRLLDFGAERTKRDGSWLDDLWLHKAYVEYRDSSVCNVSYYMTFLREPAGYPAEFKKESPPVGTFTDYQIKRAAGWTSLLLDYKHMIDTGALEPEYMDKAKTTPFCMNQYTKYFAGTRIPAEGADTIKCPFPAPAKHIVVMIKDQIYVVLVQGPNGERIPIGQIEAQFKAAVKDAQESKRQPAVGQLSTNERDPYYAAYSHLLSLSDRNRENFKRMEEALFVINLDDYNTSVLDKWGKSEDLESRSRQMLHGGPECRNRWIDKGMQWVASNDGRGGVLGEHTPADGATGNTIVGWVLKNEPAKEPHGAKAMDLPPPRKLEWDADAKVQADIGAARTFVRELISDVESRALYFDEYAGSWVKSHLKVSPDAFFQMMLQLTWARMYPHPTATYESASTRKYLLGRTEVCRTLSVSSEQFARNFGKVPAATSIQQLRDACTAHINYMKLATDGRGVDRHMLGLSNMLQAGEKMPAFLEDVVYKRGSKWLLSTSNLSVSDNTMAGFGPVYVDGYGSNYNVSDKFMTASVAARNQCKTTNANAFKETLLKSLRDVKVALESAESAHAKHGG